MKKNLLVKILLVVLALTLVISMAACGGNKKPSGGNEGGGGGGGTEDPVETKLTEKLANVVKGLDGYLAEIKKVDNVMFIDAKVQVAISDLYNFSVNAKGNLYKTASATNQNELAVEIKEDNNILLGAYLMGDDAYLQQAFTSKTGDLRAATPSYVMTKSKFSNLDNFKLNENASKIFAKVLPELQKVDISEVISLLEENASTIDGLVDGTGVISVTESETAYTIAIESDKIVTLLTDLSTLINPIVSKYQGIVDTAVSLLFGVDDYADLLATKDYSNFPKISIVAEKNTAGGIKGLKINYVGEIIETRNGPETLTLAIDLAVSASKGTVGFSTTGYDEAAFKAQINVIDKGLDIVADVYVVPECDPTNDDPATGIVTAKYKAVGSEGDYTAVPAQGFYDGEYAYFDLSGAFTALGQEVPENTQYKIAFNWDEFIAPKDAKSAAPAMIVNPDLGIDSIIGNLGTLTDFLKGLIVKKNNEFDKINIDVSDLLDIAALFLAKDNGLDEDGEQLSEDLSADNVAAFFNYYLAKFYDSTEKLKDGGAETEAAKAAEVIKAFCGTAFNVKDIITDTASVDVNVEADYIVNDGVGANIILKNKTATVASATVKIDIIKLTDAKAAIAAAALDATDFENAIQLDNDPNKGEVGNVEYVAFEGEKDADETYYVKDAEDKFVEAGADDTEGLYTKELKIIKLLGDLADAFLVYGLVD